jgi:hypothetical protein
MLGKGFPNELGKISGLTVHDANDDNDDDNDSAAKRLCESLKMQGFRTNHTANVIEEETQDITEECDDIDDSSFDPWQIVNQAIGESQQQSDITASKIPADITSDTPSGDWRSNILSLNAAQLELLRQAAQRCLDSARQKSTSSSRVSTGRSSSRSRPDIHRYMTPRIRYTAFSQKLRKDTIDLHNYAGDSTAHTQSTARLHSGNRRLLAVRSGSKSTAILPTMSGPSLHASRARKETNGFMKSLDRLPILRSSASQPTLSLRTRTRSAKDRRSNMSPFDRKIRQAEKLISDSKHLAVQRASASSLHDLESSSASASASPARQSRSKARSAPKLRSSPSVALPIAASLPTQSQQSRRFLKPQVYDSGKSSVAPIAKTHDPLMKPNHSFFVEKRDTPFLSRVFEQVDYYRTNKPALEELMHRVEQIQQIMHARDPRSKPPVKYTEENLNVMQYGTRQARAKILKRARKIEIQKAKNFQRRRAELQKQYEKRQRALAIRYLGEKAIIHSNGSESEFRQDQAQRRWQKFAIHFRVMHFSQAVLAYAEEDRQTKADKSVARKELMRKAAKKIVAVRAAVRFTEATRQKSREEAAQYVWKFLCVARYATQIRKQLRSISVRGIVVQIQGWWRSKLPLLHSQNELARRQFLRCENAYLASKKRKILRQSSIASDGAPAPDAVTEFSDEKSKAKLLQLPEHVREECVWLLAHAMRKSNAQKMIHYVKKKQQFLEKHRHQMEIFKAKSMLLGEKDEEKLEAYALDQMKGTPRLPYIRFLPKRERVVKLVEKRHREWMQEKLSSSMSSSAPC